MTDDVVRKTFVFWSDREPEREWAALEHLAEHAPGLGPRPIARQVVGERPVVVMSRARGEPQIGKLSARQTAALAMALQQLFAVPVLTDLMVRANDAQAVDDA